MTITDLTPTGRARRRTDQPLSARVDPVFAQIWAFARSGGFNQRRLAAAAGLSHATVSLLLSGRSAPNTHTLGVLAAAVGCRIAVIPAAVEEAA